MVIPIPPRPPPAATVLWISFASLLLAVLTAASSEAPEVAIGKPSKFDENIDDKIYVDTNTTLPITLPAGFYNVSLPIQELNGTEVEENSLEEERAIRRLSSRMAARQRLNVGERHPPEADKEVPEEEKESSEVKEEPSKVKDEITTKRKEPSEVEVVHSKTKKETKTDISDTEKVSTASKVPSNIKQQAKPVVVAESTSALKNASVTKEDTAEEDKLEVTSMLNATKSRTRRSSYYYGSRYSGEYLSYMQPPPPPRNKQRRFIRFPAGRGPWIPETPDYGPRSPRLVFRDPVEPGTLQAPWNHNQLHDPPALPTTSTSAEDAKGCGVSVKQGAQRRIVGGDEAGFGSFPWQAYIRIGSSRCGGSLVNRYHVVTAGHCVARANARQVQVTLGDYVINSAVEPLPAYTYGVRQIAVHPYFKFTPQADRFDVAVLRLDRPVQYMPHIAPICLPTKGEDFLGQFGWAAGWGALQPGSRLRPKTLQAVDVPVIDNRMCERWHRSNGINVVIYDEMMCAGYRGGGKDSCQGDSGGPLMLERSGRWFLIGIVSAGYSCAQRGQPGIYHRVANTVDWISHVINS